MHQDENEHPHSEDEPTHPGGAAPEHRRCHYTRASGKPCRDWAIRGQQLCYRHGVFAHAANGRSLHLPLLEDEDSIVLVLSQTLRGVVLGTIPVNQGRLLLEGCHLAHTMHMDSQKAAHVERVHRKTGDRSEETGARKQETEAGSQMAEAERHKVEATEHRTPDTEHRTPDPAPDSRHRFRDREQNRDEASHKVESRRTDPLAPEYEEARAHVLAAQAAPLDEGMEEEAVGVE